MAGKNKRPGKKPIEQYDHKGKQRVNNPPVGLVTSDTDKETGKKSLLIRLNHKALLRWILWVYPVTVIQSTVSRTGVL